MSTIVANQWQNADGTENYKVRAWVNFNGTGTVAIRESGNVSSITDNGVGDYTVNFETAMPDANYSYIGAVQSTVSFTVTPKGSSGETPSLFVGSFRFETRSSTGLADSGLVMLSIFR